MPHSEVNVFQPFKTGVSKLRLWRPISYRYFAGILGNISTVILIVLLAVEAIFLSDIIISRVLPELLSLDADMVTIFKVTLFSTPGGLFIALPTAILIGVYLIFLRRREDQEFTVSAGFGYDLKPLFAVGLFIGLCGACASLVISGFIEPLARYQFRTTITAAAHQAVKEGKLESGRFYKVGDVILYAASGRISDVAENVFIHQKKSGHINRVIFARQIQNPKITEKGHIGLVFNDAHVYEFADTKLEPAPAQQPNGAIDNCLGCGISEFLSSPKYLFFNKFYSELPPVEFPEQRNRSGLSEATLLELLFAPTSDANVVRVLGERSLRAVLCILAPFLAMVAVAMTTRATLLFAMPTAAGIVLALSFFSSSMIGHLSHYGHFVTGASILASFSSMVIICIVLVHRMKINFTRSIAITF